MRHRQKPSFLLLLSFVCLEQPSFVLLSPQASGKDIAIEQEYRNLFKNYLALVQKAAERKNIKSISSITDKFEEDYRSSNLAEVFIWHTELESKNRLLFHRTYRKGIYPLPKIQWKRRYAINVYLEEDFALVDYWPKDAVVQFRLVFAR